MNGSFWKIARVASFGVTLFLGIDSQASACLFPCLFGGWGYANYAPAYYGYGGCNPCQTYGGCGTCQPYGGWYRPAYSSSYWPSSCGCYSCNPCSCGPCGTCGPYGCSTCGPYGCATGCEVAAPAGNLAPTPDGATPTQPETYKRNQGVPPESKGWQGNGKSPANGAAPPARLNEPGASPGDLGPSGTLQQQESLRVPPPEGDQTVPQRDKAKDAQQQKSPPASNSVDDADPATPPAQGTGSNPSGSDATPTDARPLKVARAAEPLRGLDEKLTWRGTVSGARLAASSRPVSVTIARRAAAAPAIPALKLNDGWVPVSDARIANR